VAPIVTVRVAGGCGRVTPVLLNASDNKVLNSTRHFDIEFVAAGHCEIAIHVQHDNTGGVLASFVTSVDQTMQSRVAHLGMILPFTNVGIEFEGMAWKQVVCGATLAVSHINSGNETVVPGMRGLITNLQRLDSSMYDTGCTTRAGGAWVHRRLVIRSNPCSALPRAPVA
jgi:hypothetical protein